MMGAYSLLYEIYEGFQPEVTQRDRGTASMDP